MSRQNVTNNIRHEMSRQNVTNNIRHEKSRQNVTNNIRHEKSKEWPPCLAHKLQHHRNRAKGRGILHTAFKTSNGTLSLMARDSSCN